MIAASSNIIHETYSTVFLIVVVVVGGGGVYVSIVSEKFVFSKQWINLSQYSYSSQRVLYVLYQSTVQVQEQVLAITVF